MPEPQEGAKPSFGEKFRNLFSKNTPEPSRPKTPEEILAEQNKQNLIDTATIREANYTANKQRAAKMRELGLNQDEIPYYELENIASWQDIFNKNGWTNKSDTDTITEGGKADISYITALQKLEDWAYHQFDPGIINGTRKPDFKEIESAVNNLVTQVHPGPEAPTPTG